MARYIDADKFAERIKVSPAFPNMGFDGHFLRNVVLDLLDNAPTADVAPKSEVEEIIYKLECLLCHATGSKLSKYTYDLRTMETVVTDYINESYDEGYRDAKSEVAREIFAEIEEGLQYEIDLEDKNGRNAWGEGDTIGFHIHEYAEDKLDTFKIALSLLKKKYGVTDTNAGDKFFTAEQVRTMSREEVSKNYSAIMKSMKKWGEQK